MDGKISLEEAHYTATAIEDKLKELFGKNPHVGIHLEPIKKDDERNDNRIAR